MALEMKSCEGYISSRIQFELQTKPLKNVLDGRSQEFVCQLENLRKLRELQSPQQNPSHDNLTELPRNSLLASLICWKLKSSLNFFDGSSLLSDFVSLISLLGFSLLFVLIHWH